MKIGIYLLLTLLMCVAAFYAGRSSVPKTAVIDDPAQNSPQRDSSQKSGYKDSQPSQEATSLTPSATTEHPSVEALESELQSLRAEHEKIRKRYDMLAHPRHRFRRLNIGFSNNTNGLPGITEETYEFLQLDPETEGKLRALSNAFIDDLLEWERTTKGEIVQNGGRLEVDLRPMTEDERIQRLHYKEQMKQLLSADDFAILESSFSHAVRGAFNNRLVALEPLSEDGRDRYRIETYYFDEDGNNVGRSSSTTSQFPERWAHLFEAN